VCKIGRRGLHYEEALLVILLEFHKRISYKFRFSWQSGTYESNHFLKQRKRILMIAASTCNKTTKVKKLKEDEFYVYCFSFI
jgi:hypothetical protein